MTKRKKITIQKIETISEPLTCERCKYYYPLSNKDGFCFKRVTKVYKTFNCPKGEHGNPITQLTDKQKAELLKRYVEFEIYAKSVTESLNAFKELIANVFDNGEVHGKYKVVKKETERRIIDSAKVRELLKRIPNGNKYLKTVKYRYIRIIDKETDR